MSKIISIDLGTGFSAVGVFENGQPVIIPNSEGKRTTPSIVGFTDNGEIRVGDAAKRQAITNPKNTVYQIKRCMGETWEECKEDAARVTYSLVNDNGYPKVDINGKKYTPQEISAMILQKMKKTAEDYLGEEVKDVVVTVPARFSDSARQATKDACTIAGLNCRRVLAEPTAAAICYGLDKSDKDLNIIVIDCGSGTYDVSLINYCDGLFDTICVSGDTRLGGTDFDDVITKWIVQEFKNDENFDLSNDLMAMQRIVDAAEKAKIELSSSTSTEINLLYITAIEGTPKHLVKTLTRAKFEQLSHELIQRHLEPIKKVLDDAKMSKDDIDEIILVGGTTRIPAIQNLVRDFFGRELNNSVQKDEAVCCGAAIQAAILNQEAGIGDIVLLDVTPLSLGIETLGGVMTKMIEANTTIPCKKTEIFSTAQDGQQEVQLKVFSGERPMASQNKLLGQFVLTGIAPAKRGVPQIEVSFDIDANGILSVKAQDKATGKEQAIRIEASSSLSKEEIERMKAEAEANAEADKKERARVEKLNQADSLIFQTENQLKEFGDKVPGDDKAHIESALERLRDAHKSGDVSAIDNAINELNSAWQTASQKMYAQGSASANQQQYQQTNESASNSSQADNDIEDADFEEVK